uniref:Major facilitator superfamily (MFS) profile domain-containing protein n=1 Tax=Ananas comosus var. bracteatus TaxID=296719 RepID=A0A6V7PEH6_ANACO|nr:unnamed protein product [Ananas comosus var. bracteatus]
MASGAIVSAAGAKEYPGTLTLFVFLTCVVAATGGLIFGYDIGISVCNILYGLICRGRDVDGSLLKKFFPSVYWKKQDESTNQYCTFDSQLLTAFTSSLYLAALIASFFASSVTRLFGRKWSMLGGGFIFLVGAALNGAAQDIAMLIIGRILLGIGVGFANQNPSKGAIRKVLRSRTLCLLSGVDPSTEKDSRATRLSRRKVPKERHS